MEGLDHTIVVADIYDDRPLGHTCHHRPVDQELGVALIPTDTVDHHIHLRQDAPDVIAVGNNGVDFPIIFGGNGAQVSDVRGSHCHPCAQGLQYLNSRLAHDAAAQHQGMDAGRRTQSAYKLSAAAIDGHHGV